MSYPRRCPCDGKQGTPNDQGKPDSGPTIDTFAPAQLQDVFKHLEGKQEAYIKDLRDYIAVETTSINPDKFPLITELLYKFEKRLNDAGVQTESININQFLGEGDYNYPPIIFGSLGEDPKKKTILFYFHLDVHMVKAERWHTDPFKLEEVNGKFIGRGVTNSKTPALCFLHVLEAYKELKASPPVNVRVFVEGMFERASFKFEETCLLKKAAITQVDCCCVANSTWIGTKKPCVAYGQRGICYFEVLIQGMNRDLHSGDYGGVICEPMSDLIIIMNALQDHNYKITIPGVMDEVVEPTQEELKQYQKVDLDMDEMREFVGVRLMHAEKKERILTHRWRLPSLSLHGIEGAEVNQWEKTVIPSRVIGKFSIRTVEKQTPDHVAKCVCDYVGNMWKEMNSLNNLEIKMTAFTQPWVADPNSPIFQVALRAVKAAYNCDGDLIRDGSTTKASVMLRNITNKPLVLLCIGAGDSKVQCPNENIEVKQYLDGHRLIAAFMDEVARSF